MHDELWPQGGGKQSERKLHKEEGVKSYTTCSKLSEVAYIYGQRQFLGKGRIQRMCQLPMKEQNCG